MAFTTPIGNPMYTVVFVQDKRMHSKITYVNLTYVMKEDVSKYTDQAGWHVLIPAFFEFPIYHSEVDYIVDEYRMLNFALLNLIMMTSLPLQEKAVTSE